EYFNAPVTITSGYRCKEHNLSVEGAPLSKHLKGIAADFKVQDTCPKAVQDYLELMHPYEYGVGHYNYFTHLDVRKVKARW
ncbi:unnamed protein product, partial [marine sediment metagenome]